MSEMGVIIKVERGRALVMNQRCEFANILIGSRNVKIGDEVAYSLSEVIVKRRHLKSITGLVASLLVFSFMAWAAFNYFYSDKAYAYVSLDVNPGVEIAINEQGQVIRLLSLQQNRERELNLNHDSLINKTLVQALETIMQEYLEQDIITETGRNYIALSVCCICTGENDALVGQIKNRVLTFLARNNIEARVYLFSVDEHTREQAMRHGVSAARYLIWSEMGDGNKLIKPEDISLRDSWVSELARQMAYETGNEPGDEPEPGSDEVDSSRTETESALENKSNVGIQENLPRANTTGTVKQGTSGGSGGQERDRLHNNENPRSGEGASGENLPEVTIEDVQPDYEETPDLDLTESGSVTPGVEDNKKGYTEGGARNNQSEGGTGSDNSKKGNKR